MPTKHINATYGQTYVLKSDGPVTITQPGTVNGVPHTFTVVEVTDTNGIGVNREITFTSIASTMTMTWEEGTHPIVTPGFNRGAASAQGSAVENTTGSTPLSPAAQAFLSFVTDGKLMFTPDGRLKINASVDATGTFNHDGYASNYTKTIDGAKFTTTVNATEVIVKKSVAGVETVLMHLHDGALELGGAVTANGERVVTDEYNLRREEASMTLGVDDINNVLELAPHAIGEEEAYIQGRFLKLPLVFTFSDTVKRVYISCSGIGEAAREDARGVYVAKNADVYVRETGIGPYSGTCRLNPGMDCQSLTYTNNLETIYEICSANASGGLTKDIPLTVILPSLKSATFPNNCFRQQVNLHTVRVFAPAWQQASTNFFTSDTVGSPLSKESVLYTLKHFGVTSGTDKVLKIGIDKALISEDPETHEQTLLDPELQAAHAARVANGWSIIYVPSA